MLYVIVALDKNECIVSKTETSSKEIAVLVKNKYKEQGYEVKFFTEE